MSGCEYRTASDGTIVRVRGDITQEALDALTAQVKAINDRMCKHEGPHVMPEIAQRIHGRKHYMCGLDAGHDGDCRWSHWTWPSEVTR